MKFALALAALQCLALGNAALLPGCATVKCAEACLDNPTRCVSRCNAAKSCPNNLGCVNGYCECPQDTILASGRCRPISWGPMEGVCKDGKCSVASSTTIIDNCSFVRCGPDFVCHDARCLPIFTRPALTPTTTAPYDPCAAVQCLTGSTCKDGKCSIATSTTTPAKTTYDQCIHIKCSSGYVCYKSRCRPASAGSPFLIDYS